MLNGCRAVLFPYGAGKSWPVIKYAYSLEPPQAPVIIACRKRNPITWERELQKRAPWVHVIKADGTAAVRKRAWMTARAAQKEGDVLAIIVPYSVLHSDERYLQDTFNWPVKPRCFVWDESTTVKNLKAKVTQAAIRISGLAHAAGIPNIIMTGNLAPENYTEVFAQYLIAYGQRHPLCIPGKVQWWPFLNRWFVQGDWKQWAIRADKIHEFRYKVQSKACLLLREDHAQIPKPREQYTMEFYDLSAWQREALNILYEFWELPLDHDGDVAEYQPTEADAEAASELATPQTDVDVDVNLEFALAVMLKAQQLCSGFYYDKNGMVHVLCSMTENPKLKLLLEILEELFAEKPSRKIILWRRFKFEDTILLRACAKYGIVKGPDAGAITAFMERPTVHLIVMPVQSAQGFNELAVADTDIYFSNDYSNEARGQAESRTARVGQLAPLVRHIDLVANNSQDQEVITALQAKTLTPEKLRTIVRIRKRGQ